jgi:hypothetical protein
MPDNCEATHRPLASLLSKSEKAQQKLKAGSWQHAMLEENIKALRVAIALLFEQGRKQTRYTQSDLQQATKALAAMISRSVKAQVKFAHGTSPHTLQRNRIKALRLAKKATTAELKRLKA